MTDDDDGVKGKNNRVIPIREGRKSLDDLEPLEFMGDKIIGYNLADVSGKYRPVAVSWILKDWIARGEVTLAAGPGGLGKSTFFIAMGLSISSGEDFLNLGVTQSQRVAYLTTEDTAKDLFRSAEAAVEYNGIQVPPTFFLLSYGKEELSAIVTEWGMNTDALKEWVRMVGKELRADVLIVDPLMNLIEGDLNSARDATRLIKFFKTVGKECECGVVLVNHTRKVADKSKITLMDSIGSVAFGNGARVALVVRDATAKDINPEAGEEVGGDLLKTLAGLVAVDRDKNNNGMLERGMLFQRHSQFMKLQDPDQPEDTLRDSVGVIGPYKYNDLELVELDQRTLLIQELRKKEHSWAVNGSHQPKAVDTVRSFMEVDNNRRAFEVLNDLIHAGVLEKCEITVQKMSGGRMKNRKIVGVKVSARSK